MRLTRNKRVLIDDVKLGISFEDYDIWDSRYFININQDIRVKIRLTSGSLINIIYNEINEE